MRKLSIIPLVLLALSATLYADTAAFPKYDSAFTITVPEDMTVKVDSDAMVLRTRDENKIASFVFLELSPNEAHDNESARKFVERYVDEKMRALAIEVTKPVAVTEESLNNRLKGLTAEAEGKKGSFRIFYTASAFSFDDKRYFLMVSFRDYTSTADNTRHKALKASIAPSTLVGGKVGFPKDHPIFTVELPKGWKANIRGDGTLLISTTTGEDISTLWDFALRGLSMHGDATVKGFAQRRAIYTLIDRRNPPELLTQFDFPSPDVESGRRYETPVDLRDKEIQLRYDRHRADTAAVVIYFKGQRQGMARLLDAVANGLRRRKEQP